MAYTKTIWVPGTVPSVNAPNLNKIEQGIFDAHTKADAALPATSYTAADVLAKLLTVDGVGSGLDADLFDGINSDKFIYGDNVRGNTFWTTGVNNIVKAGFYWVDTDLTNLPVTNLGYLIHKSHNAVDTFASQTFYEYNTNRHWERRKNSGTWSAWVEFWQTDKLRDNAGDLEFFTSAAWKKAGMGASLFNSNGYRKLADGSIEQWGFFNATANASASATFPIAFTTECYAVSCIATVSNCYAGGFVKSITDFTIQNNGGATVYYYRAIGK